MVLQNPVSFIGFAIILWRFFYRRTRGLSSASSGSFSDYFPVAEERALVQFFGNDYESYRRRVATWIPFIP